MYIKGFTHEMVVNEVKYHYSKLLITGWLKAGEITKQEFEELDKMNGKAFNSIIKDLI